MLGSAQQTINPAYLGNRMKRLLAFFIDIFPITFLVIMIYRQYFNYDVLLDEFLADYDNPALRDSFMEVQNQISMISLVIYIFYAFALEASTYQATYGKKLLGLCVVRQDGAPLELKDALWRNLFKIVSQVVLNMGFFWILFDRNKRGWHDMIGKTLVIETEYKDAFEGNIQPNEEIINVPISEDPIEFRSIFEGNQSNLLFPPAIELIEFEKIKHLVQEPNEKVTEYVGTLIEDLQNINKEISEDVLWNNNTLGQKLLRVFSFLDASLNNGGILQFLFDHPNYIFALKDVFKVLEQDELSSLYQSVLLEQGLIDEDGQIKPLLNDDPLTFSKWQGLQKNLNESEALQKLETVIASNEVQKKLYNKLCNFIETNHLMFV